MTQDLIDTADGINGPNSLPGGSGPWVVGGSAVKTMRDVGPSSYHPGGCHFTMADGSVQWISDYIDVKPSSPYNLSVWDRLNTSADEQVIPSKAF